MLRRAALIFWNLVLGTWVFAKSVILSQGKNKILVSVHMHIRAAIKTSLVRRLHCWHFPVKFPEIVCKGKHEILLQYLGINIFNIRVCNGAGHALILVEYIITRKFDFTSLIFKYFFTKVHIPQGVTGVNI